MNQIIETGAIAARFCTHVQRTWYVSDLPEYRNGKQHGDFGYSETAEKAILLSPYWQRRFRAQVRYCSKHDTVTFFPITVYKAA